MLNIVAYCRLSKEDGDDDISTSITNQKKIIEEYALNNGMFVKQYYIDDGQSGYTMNRTAFNRLKNDLNNDEVDVIIVKDLSRLGRHNAKVQLFLENILESGKRLIAIGDNYDSYNTQSHDMVGIQTWINEKYVRDVSTKIRKSIDTMQKEGRYISSVPYGYYIDPFKKGSYHVDETCAMYVKEIFDLYLEGYGTQAIAINLTTRNVPTGTMITKQRLERQGKPYGREVSTRWTPNVVMRILRNDFYIGTLTLGKTKRRAINGKKIEQPEENYYKFEDAHEPIVDKKTFQLVQEEILERTRTRFRGRKVRDRDNIFIGVLWCADCESRMTSAGHTQNTRYVCSLYNMLGTNFCSCHSVTESELKDILIYFLEHCRDNLSEAISDLDKLIQENAKKDNNNTLPMLELDLQKVETELKLLLEQKMRETMKNPMMVDTIDEMYSKIINEKYAQINSLKTQIEDQQKTLLKSSDIASDLHSAMDIINSIIYSKKITKKQIATIIDKIIVHEDSGIDIYLKGNLHELCTNYIQIKNTNKGRILQATVDYIKENQDNIGLMAGLAYVKEQGYNIGYINYSKIFLILVDKGYLFKKKGNNTGYRLNVPFEQLQADLVNNIVDNSTSWVRKNYVTFEMVMDICKWVQGLQYKKRLF